jgi:hypothetical protein
MATTASARLLVSIVGDYEKTATGGTLSQPINEKIDMALSNGVGELQFNRVFKKSGTATTAAGTAIDLSGTDTDDFGDVTAATEVVAVLIKHLTPGGGNLLVGGGANDIADFATIRTIRPGINATTKPGFDLWVSPDANGSPVAAGVTDKITVDTSAGSVAWEMVVLARA